MVCAVAAQNRPAVFRIQPVRPVAELRVEALAAKPPAELGSFRKSDLVDLAALAPRIKLDIRYATPDNFLSTPVYSSARAFLQRPAAEALLRAHRELTKQGYGLLIFDAYRPWYVTKMFWDATPPDKHEFVANPAEGSRHNRGCAVDLSLYDLKTGREVEMTGVYDEMSERSYPDYAGGTAVERSHRQLLRRAMEKQGFTVFPSEWWHFDYQDWKQYAIQNVPFEQIATSNAVFDNAIEWRSDRRGVGVRTQTRHSRCQVTHSGRRLHCSSGLLRSVKDGCHWKSLPSARRWFARLGSQP
jgi:D-alanyl-D-alanine dipeptidase